MSIELDPITQSHQSKIQFLTACFAFQDTIAFPAFTHVAGSSR